MGYFEKAIFGIVSTILAVFVMCSSLAIIGVAVYATISLIIEDSATTLLFTLPLTFLVIKIYSKHICKCVRILIDLNR